MMKKTNLTALLISTLIASPYCNGLATQLLDLTPLTSGKFEHHYWIVKEKYHYTAPEKAHGISACVMLQYDINEQGKFENPVILGHINGDLFKNELIASMKKWQWEPTASNPQRQPIRWVRYFGRGDNERKIREKCMSAHKVG